MPEPIRAITTIFYYIRELFKKVIFVFMNMVALINTHRLKTTFKPQNKRKQLYEMSECKTAAELLECYPDTYYSQFNWIIETYSSSWDKLFNSDTFYRAWYETRILNS